MKIRNKHAFTLVETLIVLSILSILSVVLVQIFISSLRGGSKAQIVGIVKQNGQAALETMDKAIRNADEVICPQANTTLDTLVIQKSVTFIRFKFNLPTASPPVNGFISQDNVGDCTSPLGANYTSLTNLNITNGASVSGGSFTRNSKTGFNDLITIFFNISPAVSAPQILTSTIDPIRFNTTVQLR